MNFQSGLKFNVSRSAASAGWIAAKARAARAGTKVKRRTKFRKFMVGFTELFQIMIQRMEANSGGRSEGQELVIPRVSRKKITGEMRADRPAKQVRPEDTNWLD